MTNYSAVVLTVMLNGTFIVLPHLSFTTKYIGISTFLGSTVNSVGANGLTSNEVSTFDVVTYFAASSASANFKVTTSTPSPTGVADTSIDLVTV